MNFTPICWGHFLMVSCVLAGSELFAPNRSNWPWVWLLILPVLTVVSSTGSLHDRLPLRGHTHCRLVRRSTSGDIRLVIMAVFIFLVLLWPTIFYFTNAPSDRTAFHLTPGYWMTPFWTLILQWWRYTSRGRFSVFSGIDSAFWRAGITLPSWPWPFLSRCSALPIRGCSRLKNVGTSLHVRISNAHAFGDDLQGLADSSVHDGNYAGLRHFALQLVAEYMDEHGTCRTAPSIWREMRIFRTAC